MQSPACCPCIKTVVLVQYIRELNFYNTAVFIAPILGGWRVLSATVLPVVCIGSTTCTSRINICSSNLYLVLCLNSYVPVRRFRLPTLLYSISYITSLVRVVQVSKRKQWFISINAIMTLFHIARCSPHAIKTNFSEYICCINNSCLATIYRIKH